MILFVRPAPIEMQGEIADQYITFDLGKVQSLDKIRLWNYIERRRGLMNYGIKDFDILASADGHR